jgi:hypothetical protein
MTMDLGVIIALILFVVVLIFFMIMTYLAFIKDCVRSCTEKDEPTDEISEPKEN